MILGGPYSTVRYGIVQWSIVTLQQMKTVRHKAIHCMLLPLLLSFLRLLLLLLLFLLRLFSTSAYKNPNDYIIFYPIILQSILFRSNLFWSHCVDCGSYSSDIVVIQASDGDAPIVCAVYAQCAYLENLRIRCSWKREIQYKTDMMCDMMQSDLSRWGMQYETAMMWCDVIWYDVWW